MKKQLKSVVPVVFLLCASLFACGPSEEVQDTGSGVDILIPDWGEADNNTGDNILPDTGADVPEEDLNIPEVTETTTPDSTGEVTGDETPVDIPAEDQNEPEDVPPDVPPVNEFCNSLLDCQPYEICDLSLGRCEERSSYKMIVGNEDLFEFKPPEGQYGDFIILDGSRFITNLATTTVRADIDKGLIAGSSIAHSTVSPHRILGVVQSKGGEIGVVFQDASPLYQKYPEPFVYNNTTVMACDGSTPAATGTAGLLGEVGPYAAGHVDFTAEDVRVYYPAECGSVRRPGIPGTYPVLIIVPEAQDANFPFINFDYLGQMLASWGIVTISLDAQIVEDDPQGHAKKLFATAPKYLNADLGSLHASMTGVMTSGTFAWLAFGSGADTLNLLKDVDKENTIHNKAVASIAMAPSFKMNNNSSQYFMALYGPLDNIANNSYANNSYDAFNTPKWKVQVVGGNHSLFTDHQMYYGGGMMPIIDGDPEIMRKDQQYLSVSMILPLLQLAFGLDQPFEDRIKNAFSDGKLVVSKG